MKSKAGPVRAYSFYLLVTAFFLASLLSLSPSIPTDNRARAAAPITPSGLNTHISDPIVSGSGPTQTTQYDITGGARPGGGTNLFHSFGEFGVPPNNIANFLNETALPTSNILARVTGNIRSDIFGTIQTTGFGNANLFLMNPYGFLFGPNATVNVGGMMTFTSADYLRLADTAQFNAIPNAIPDALLSASPVAAFGFIGSNPRAINFEGGQLTVANGTGITLVGGDINLAPDSFGTSSGITAPGRPILLTSVGGPGSVAADTGVPTPGLALGTIALGQGATLDTSYNSGASVVGDGSGGAVSIRGGHFVSTGAHILTNPAFDSTGHGGAVTITASDTASFIDSTIDTNSSFFVGSAGAVSVTANDSLEMTNTDINTSAIFAGGDGGPVTLGTYGLLSLTNSFIRTQASAPGNGGAVTITGKDVTLNNSSMFTFVNIGFLDLTIDPALGLVHPGAVTITAENTVSISGSFVPGIVPTISASASGTLMDAGSVTISGKTVNLSNGLIDVSLQEGQIANPGNSGTIEIRGNNVNLSQFTLQSDNADFAESTGKGGSILLRGADNLRADSIQLTDSSLVDARSVTGGGAGNIEFQTKALTLSDHTFVSVNSLGPGSGGLVTVSGAENVTIESGSNITTAVGSVTAEIFPHQGAAGNILLETQNLTIRGGGQIAATTHTNSLGDAGNITVQGTNGSAQSVLIDGTGSGIFADTQGTGAGGNIHITSQSLTLQNGGTVSSTAAQAQGGNINITAGRSVTLSNGSLITASSSGAGNAGDIMINAGQNYTSTDSAVTTQATHASGGNIKVLATDTVQLTNNSQLNASVQGSSTTVGGNITIDPQYVILQNSQIRANATQGQGGAISIIINNGGLFLADANSPVSASSQFGTNGTVTIQNPNAPAGGQIQPLGKTPLLATTLLNQHCAALAGGEFSSFTVVGRDSLPTEPGGWLTSPLATLSGGTGLGMKAEGVKAEGERPNIPILSLRQIAPAGFLTQAFAVDSSASCQS